MKKLLLILLLIPSLCYGEDLYARLSVPLVGAGVAAATCSTPATGNLLNDGFEGTANSGYENSGWTESGSADSDATAPSSGPTGTCSHSLEIAYTGTAAYAYYNINRTSNRTYMRFWLYVETEDVDDSEQTQVFYSGESTGGTTAACVRLYLTQASGQFQLGGAGATVNLSTGQWYQIDIDTATFGTTCVSVDGGACNAVTCNNNYNNYIMFGEPAASNPSATYDIERCHVSSGAM